jgi:hypothetical protein
MATNIDASPLAVPADLATAGTKVRGIANALAEELNTLQQKLAPLEGSWTGNAKGYFEGLEQEWNLAAKGLWGDGSVGFSPGGSMPGKQTPQGDVGLLPFIAAALDSMYVNYENAENSNIKTWQR